jgi:hypothetical protein
MLGDLEGVPAAIGMRILLQNVLFRSRTPLIDFFVVLTLVYLHPRTAYLNSSTASGSIDQVQFAPRKHPLLNIMFRRLYSTAVSTTSVSTSSHEIAANFLSRCQRRGPMVQTQFIDANQLQRLSQTLNRPELHPGHSIARYPPENGTILPPGYHLAYFTPSAFEAELGSDGSDQVFNPSVPFTRRMWAGGKMIWFQDNSLRVGDTVTETTTLLSAEPKRKRDGEDMIVVGVEKRVENKSGVALIDTRQVSLGDDLSASYSN